MELLITRGFLALSRRRLQHQRGRGGGFRDDNHSILKLYAIDGWVIVEKPCEKPHMCNKKDNPDNPSDNNGTQPSGNSHRKPCYGLQVEGPQSMAQSFSTHQGILAPPLYPVESVHALATPIIIVIGLRLNQRVERVYNLAIPNDHDSHRANTGSLVVGSLKVYRSKIPHLSSLYLFHMCLEISATSSRNHLGDKTSMSLPCERIS